MKNRMKIMLLMLGILALFSIASIGIFVFFADSQIKVTEGEIKFFVTYEKTESDYCLYNTADNEYCSLEVKANDLTSLYILNGKEDVKSVYVIISNQAGEIVVQDNFLKDDEKYILNFQQEKEEIYELSFVVFYEEHMEFYISSEERFLDVIGDSRVENQTVNFLTDICIKNCEENTIEFMYPYIWNLGKYSFETDKTLHFSGENEGIMYIHNQSDTSFNTGLITCNTPQWSYEIDNLFGEFEEDNYYYIKAKDINGKNIDITSLYVDSQKKLDEILISVNTEESEDGFQFKLPTEVTSVKIVGDYELGIITTEQALKIELVGNSDVVFDAVNVELAWSGESAPTFEIVEQYMNVKSYNGQQSDMCIGGLGDNMLLSGGVKLSAGKENAFVIDGNYINVYTGYADTIALEDGELSYELSNDGAAEIIKDKENYYLVTTNTEGKTWGYKINIIEKEYKLPVIYIETENGEPITSKEIKISGKFSLDYNGTKAYENIDSYKMKIRGRGHASWKLDKKPYKIKFEEKVSLFGLTAAKEWVLQANHADKSLIRNKLAMDMGNVLDNVLFTPHSYNVDVFVNGTYMGVYTLTEQIEVNEGRIKGEKDGTSVDTDYLVELAGDAEETEFGTNMFNSLLYLAIEIKNPDSDILTKEQYEFISDYMRKADKAVMQLDGYEEYVDLPSLIDWFLLTEISYNIDGAFRRSDYIYKKAGDKLYMAAYWDFDYAFSNFWRDEEPFDEWICLGNGNTVKDNYIRDNWITFLLEDPKFIEQLKIRWNQVGSKLYETAMATINEAEEIVSPSAEENFARWPGILGRKIQYESKKCANISTYEGQLQHLRDFIEKRYKWMDETIQNM